MKQFEVIFYETEEKECPVELFLSGLEVKLRGSLRNPGGQRESVKGTLQ